MSDISNVGSSSGTKRTAQIQDTAGAARKTPVRQGNVVSYQGSDNLLPPGISPSTPDLDKPQLDVGSLTQLLLQVRMKLSEIQTKFGKEDVKANGLAQKALNDKRAKKILDAIKKMDKASKSGSFGQIFGWVAASALVIAGAALMVASGGAGAPLFVAGLLAMTMMTLQQTGAMDTITSKLAGAMTQMFEAFGMSKDKAKIAGQIAAQVAIAVVVIAATTAVAVASGGGGAAAEVTALQKAASAVSLAARIASGAAAMGTGASQIATSVYQYQATNSRADATEIKKQLMQMQALIQEELDDLQAVIADQQELTSKAVNLITTHSKSQETIARNVSA